MNIVRFLLCCIFRVEEPLERIEYLTDRIVGGREAGISEIPYQVGIMHGSGIWCGGSLYSTDTVISAAHCFTSDKLSSYLIFTGKSNLKVQEDYEQISVPASIIRYPKYDSGLNDVAVIKLKTPFCLTGHTQPLPLTKPGFTPNGKSINHSRWALHKWDYTGQVRPIC